MADLADLGNDRAEEQLADILASRQRPAAIVGAAKCLHCGAEIQHAPSLRIPQRWCDSDCRDEWQKRHPSPRRAAPTRERLVVEGGMPGALFLPKGKGIAGGTAACDMVEAREIRKAAEADTALIALQGHR